MGQRVWLILIGLMLPLTALAEEGKAASTLAEPLQAFSPYVGRSWRGEFSDSTPEKPVIDVSTWEVALQGQAVRITHSLNDGDYEGETFVVFNRDTQKLEFFYFTSAGFYTKGTAEFEGNSFVSYEQVTGNDSGITEVRAEVTLEGDTMHHQAYYLKQGEWVKGHSAIYRAQ